MNQRFLELAQKAGLKFPSEGKLSPQEQKFAELIVGECAGIYDKIDNGNLHMGTDDYLEALHKTFRS